MDIPYEHFDDVEGIVKSYDFPEWLIAMETSPRDHIHFLIFSDNNQKNALFNRLCRKYDLKHNKKHGGKRKYGVLRKEITNLEKFKRYLAKEGMIRGSESIEQLEQYIDDQIITSDGASKLVKNILTIMEECKIQLQDYPDYDLKLWIIKEIFKETKNDYVPSKQLVNKVALIFYRRYKTIEQFYQLLFNL